MKFIVFTISFLIVSLSNFTLQSNQKSLTSLEINQNDVYLNLTHKINEKDILAAGCSACHMRYSLTGESMVTMEDENFLASISVHQENNSTFIPALKSFISSHSPNEAAEKLVDYNELILFVEGYVE